MHAVLENKKAEAGKQQERGRPGGLDCTSGLMALPANVLLVLSLQISL